MTLAFPRRLAILGGVVLPIAETARRWHQLGDPHIWPFWLDDWAVGALLLYGAWRTRRNDVSGLTALGAAWGFACAMGYTRADLLDRQ